MTEEPTQAGEPGQRRAARPQRRRSRAEAGPPPARPPAEASGPGASAGPAAPSRPAQSSPPADSSRAGASAAAAPRSTGPGPDRRANAGSRPRRARRDAGRGDRPEAGNDGPWRELTGSGRSQVSQAAALRARDADRPTPADLAQAERDVVIQRRNWTPG